MLRSDPAEKRQLRTVPLEGQLVIVGGGLAGTCCAVTAARAGLKVILVQDRPVLGGNASSEVRLWILGATSHMGNNNRWAREGGVVDEILVENMYRNPEGNPLIVDTILLEKVVQEPNITLLLNTAVFDLEKSDADTLQAVRAFCSQNSTLYQIHAPLFVDASGDGILAFMAGAAFRIGAEARSEFNELFAPPAATQELLGHTIYFYSKDAGRPVRFVPPSFALADITRIPRWRDFRAADSGCRLWWLEWGGRLDTVHDSETIKWELWKVAYGVWNHIKNSGKFPEADNLTLEWVGSIPGKRESRRFEGDYMLNQLDIVEQRPHSDAVSFGGWAIDLHPADGVYSAGAPCSQWHSKGIYPIPYRCLYSRNITNLFLAGRIISASHIAFGSTRVMATCAHAAQAVALAAALCSRDQHRPRTLLAPERMGELQRALLRTGQFIPGVALRDPADIAHEAVFLASSELKLERLTPSGETLALEAPWAMMLPVPAGPMPEVRLLLDVAAPCELAVELRSSEKPDNHTPDVILETQSLHLDPGRQQVLPLRFNAVIDPPRYVFVCLLPCAAVRVHLSNQRVTGVLALKHGANSAVAKSARQIPPENSGLDPFEFWLPQRRPGGKNFALALTPPLDLFQVGNLRNGFGRPTRQPNAWVASFEDPQPVLTLTWPAPKVVRQIELVFDTDYDHPMESVLLGHPERVMPFCIPRFTWRDPAGNILHHCAENHQSRSLVRFDPPVRTAQLTLTLSAPQPKTIPAALFELRCYES